MGLPKRNNVTLNWQWNWTETLSECAREEGEQCMEGKHLGQDLTALCLVSWSRSHGRSQRVWGGQYLGQSVPGCQGGQYLREHGWGGWGEQQCLAASVEPFYEVAPSSSAAPLHLLLAVAAAADDGCGGAAGGDDGDHLVVIGCG